MNTLEAIHNRQSVRKYKSDPITDEVLTKILEAGLVAPSWANVQATFVIVVKDQAIKEKLADALTPKNPAANAARIAPVVLAIGFKANESGFYKGAATTIHGDYGMFDAGLVAANLSLAACDQGLGTVHAAAIDIQKATEALRIPENCKLVEIMPLGYPDHEPKRVGRKPLDQFAMKETYTG